MVANNYWLHSSLQGTNVFTVRIHLYNYSSGDISFSASFQFATPINRIVNLLDAILLLESSDLQRHLLLIMKTAVWIFNQE